MNRAGLFILLASTALSLGFNPVLAAAEPEKRPRLEDYPNAMAWLQALQAHDRRQQTARQPRPTPVAAPPQASPLPVPVPEGVDPASETAPPPLLVTGPEDLERAVELARDIHHPDYVQPIRYNRTTHLSFPLDSIESQDMSQTSVGDTLDLQGETEEEKAASLKLLTAKLDHDQRLLQDKTGESTLPVNTRGAVLPSAGSLQNGHGTVSITVESR